MKVSLPSPAKVNLFLAVTGRRADGFHDLVSVAALLDFSDELEVAPAAAGFTLECDDAAVPTDGNNLVLKAAAAFVAATGWKGGGHFKLTKRIPMGAGLGGGSGNAVTAVRLQLPPTARRAGPLQLARVDDPHWLPMHCGANGITLIGDSPQDLLLGAGQYELCDPLAPLRRQRFEVPARDPVVLIDSLAVLRAGRP